MGELAFRNTYYVRSLAELRGRRACGLWKHRSCRDRSQRTRVFERPSGFFLESVESENEAVQEEVFNQRRLRRQTSSYDWTECLLLLMMSLSPLPSPVSRLVQCVELLTELDSAIHPIH